MAALFALLGSALLGCAVLGAMFLIAPQHAAHTGHLVFYTAAPLLWVGALLQMVREQKRRHP
jgi:hypothetical protein